MDGNILQKIHMDQWNSSLFLSTMKRDCLSNQSKHGAGGTDDWYHICRRSRDQIEDTSPKHPLTRESIRTNDNRSILYGKFKVSHNPGTQSEYAPKRNLTKSVYYTANTTTGQWEVSTTTLYTNDYNGRNLPVEAISKTLDKDGKQTNTNRVSYVYQDCQ